MGARQAKVEGFARAVKGHGFPPAAYRALPRFTPGLGETHTTNFASNGNLSFGHPAVLPKVLMVLPRLVLRPASPKVLLILFACWQHPNSGPIARPPEKEMGNHERHLCFAAISERYRIWR
jgi:hypothetical protein